MNSLGTESYETAIHEASMWDAFIPRWIDRSSGIVSVASKSPSRIPSFRTPIPFLPRSDTRVRSIFHLAPVYHSKRSYLPETRRPTSVDGESCDIGLSRSDLYYRTVLPWYYGVITLDFKRFDSIYGINLEERSKNRITHCISKNRCIFIKLTHSNNFNQILLLRTNFHI